MPMALLILRTSTVRHEDYVDLSREKMNEIGIKPGHQAKLAKRIAEELSGKEGTR